VVVDLTAPTVPTLDNVNDNVPGGVQGNLTSGQVTNDSTPTISGTGQAGSTIHIMNNGTQIGTTIVDGSGNWSFTRPRRWATAATPCARMQRMPQATPRLTHRSSPLPLIPQPRRAGGDQRD
jgi:hypothetical protein